jgi:hypothetical protein
MAATAVLVAEADKLTLGQELTVLVPQSILTLMEDKENTRVYYVKTHTFGWRLRL